MTKIDLDRIEAQNTEMLPLLFGAVIFFFMAIGAAAFVVCFTTPPLRRFALSCALWFAAWGPCLVAWMMLTGLALAAKFFVTRIGDVERIHLPRLPVGLGWGYVLLAILSTAAIATCMAFLHQTIVRRFTFALFRLYATAVSAGIGSVVGWALAFSLIVNFHFRFEWLLCVAQMLLLVTGFAVMSYKTARSLRGEHPTRFPWATADEFAGP